jgi:hypothetical protein
VYVDGILYDLSGIPGFSVDISSQLQYGRTFTITSVYKGIETTPSNPAIYLVAPTNLSFSGTILSWSGPADVSYNVYVDGILYDLSGIPGVSIDISSQLQYGRTFTITSIYSNIESPPSDPAIYLAAPTNLSFSGTILSWAGPVDVSYNVYVDGILYDLSGIPGFSVDISSQLQYGRTFTITSDFSGSESPFSAPITYYPPVPPTPTPTRSTKPMSNKALRIANSFSSASARTRVIAGREIIRSLQSGSKRNFSSIDTMAQISAARIYIIGKNPT